MDDYKCIAVELRGHGRLPPVRGGTGCLFALTWMWFSLILMFVIGISSMSCISVGVVILQQNTPRELQARVMSLWTWGIALAFLGALPVGAFSELYGAPITMAVTAALGVASGLALMAWYAGQSGKRRTASLASSLLEENPRLQVEIPPRRWTMLFTA